MKNSIEANLVFCHLNNQVELTPVFRKYSLSLNPFKKISKHTRILLPVNRTKGSLLVPKIKSFTNIYCNDQTTFYQSLGLLLSCIPAGLLTWRLPWFKRKYLGKKRGGLHSVQDAYCTFQNVSVAYPLIIYLCCTQEIRVKGLSVFQIKLFDLSKSWSLTLTHFCTCVLIRLCSMFTLLLYTLEVMWTRSMKTYFIMWKITEFQELV